jgi:hypothetical protein
MLENIFLTFQPYLYLSRAILFFSSLISGSNNAYLLGALDFINCREDQLNFEDGIFFTLNIRF